MKKFHFRSFHMYLLVILRIAIGWHFLYEGVSKLIIPGWSAEGYLLNATGFMGPLFRSLALEESSLAIINFLNIWGLILVGLGLLLGLLTKWAQFGAIFLLAMYYLANPPFLSHTGVGFEGSYLFLSKDLFELLTLVVLSFFPTGMFLGLDGLSAQWRKGQFQHVNHQKEDTQSDTSTSKLSKVKRREMFRHLATLPILGGFTWAVVAKMKGSSNEDKHLVDGLSGASIKKFEFKGIEQLQGDLPKGIIKDRSFSKLILGGNLLSGWAHSRDLIYVSSLVRAYHTKDKIFNTFRLAEKCGVDTLLSHPVIVPVINEYWDKGYGNMQFISDLAGLDYDGTGTPTAKPFEEYKDLVKRAIDGGATAAYIQGETADYYINAGLIDEIYEVMDIVRRAGLPSGIGAHRIETVRRCVELGFERDFWMKTLHHHNYWSAKHPQWHDNMYCYHPDETIAFMESLKEPWIAFKVLAAGALKPEEAFEYAFHNGADLLCVGMYDFQIVDDVNYALQALDKTTQRKRAWMA